MHSLHEIDCADPTQTDYLQLYSKFRLMLPLKTRVRTNDVSADVALFVRCDVADERVLTGVVTILRDRIILHLSTSLRTSTRLLIHTPILALTNSFSSFSLNHLSSHSLTHSLTSPTQSSTPNSYFL